MMLNKWWVWVGTAVLICWTLGAHNRLVRLRAQVMQRFLTLESWVLQYPDIVHEAVTAAAMAPAGWRSTIGFDLGTEHWNQLRASGACLDPSGNFQSYWSEEKGDERPWSDNRG